MLGLDAVRPQVIDELRADARKALGRDEKAKSVTFLARSSSGIASCTARSASRPAFQAMTMLSPTGPGVQSGGRISIGAPDLRSARSSTPRRMTSCAKLSGPGALIRLTQWVKTSPSPGFSAGTKIAVGAASPVTSVNIRLTAASLSASAPARGALTLTPINRAP